MSRISAAPRFKWTIVSASSRTNAGSSRLSIIAAARSLFSLTAVSVLIRENPADAITFSALSQRPSAAVQLLHCCRLTIAGAIERQVQFQDVHAGLAEKPSPSRPRVGVDDGAHTVCTDATGLG